MPGTVEFLIVSSVLAACHSSGQELPYLRVFYSAEDTDNAVLGATAMPPSPTYKLAHNGTSISTVAKTRPSDLLPDDCKYAQLFRFYNSRDRTDTITTSSQKGILYAKVAGYTKQSLEGWVIHCLRNSSTGDSAPGSAVAVGARLTQYWSAARIDHFLVSTPEGRRDAIASGYIEIKSWDEGYGAASWTTFPDGPVPDGCPFARSTAVPGIQFLYGVYGSYGGADTWFPSWGADGDLYTGFTDGVVNGIKSASYKGANATTGMAIVSGDDPLQLDVHNVTIYQESALPYQGRYPSANLFLNGTWYYGTYALINYKAGRDPAPDCGNWCVQGPFVGFRYSKDRGRSWIAPRKEMKGPNDTLFGEVAPSVNPPVDFVRFGAPHVVDCGQELEHCSLENAEEKNIRYSSADDLAATDQGTRGAATQGVGGSDGGKFVYLIGHGATGPGQHESWMQGSAVHLARFDASLLATNSSAINDGRNWEFFAGRQPGSAGAPVWVRGAVDKAEPIFTWPNRTGVVTATYAPVLKRFLIFVSTPRVSPYTNQNFDTYVLESPRLTGGNPGTDTEYRLVTYMQNFGTEAYFVNLPSKFVGTGLNDGGASDAPSTGASALGGRAQGSGTLDAWLSYSANFASGVAVPPGSGYHWSLQKMRFLVGRESTRSRLFGGMQA